MNMDTTSDHAGFGPIFRSSPLVDLLGGFVSRGSGCDLEIALRVGPNHVNTRGQLHGGVAATLADCGMGYLVAYRSDPPLRMVTVSMTLDYVAPANAGDWVHVVIDGSDVTRRLVFASGRLMNGDAVVAHIRGVYSLTTTAAAPPLAAHAAN